MTAHLPLPNAMPAFALRFVGQEALPPRLSEFDREQFFTLDWLRRIGPAHFSHINFRGTMRFGVEKFAAALIQRAPGRATRMAS